MDAQLLASEALTKEVLALVAANAAAMRALGAVSEAGGVAQAMVARAAAAASPDAAALLRSLHAALTKAMEAGDVARGRALLAHACRCRRVRAAAATASASAVPPVVVNARARAIAAIAADLACDDAALCGGAPALQRLCEAPAPPVPPFWAPSAAHASGSSTAATVAAKWRMLARDVADAAPEEEAPANAALTPEEERDALAARIQAFLDLGLQPRNSRAKQLRFIDASAEEVAAGKALSA
jgi:hypothetical protein